MTRGSKIRSRKHSRKHSRTQKRTYRGGKNIKVKVKVNKNYGNIVGRKGVIMNIQPGD